MTKIKKCPKCGSKHMKWIKKGDRGYYECDACGYVGIHAIEEDGDDNPEISW
ncbi:MAG: hypothetical protein NT001_06160 [Candidatus Woesearchaeota archaeon]|nr:hypothetical protein [Candidatus Woesearchaeota archaeon]